MTQNFFIPLHSFGLALLACLVACTSDPETTDGSSGVVSSTGAETGTQGTQGDTAAPTTTAPTTSSPTTNTPTTGAAESTTGAGSEATGTTGTDDTGEATDTTGPVVPTEKFSFFVTSLVAMQELSGNQEGFGGDLRFGEEGLGAGLRGADKICAAIAEKSMPGAGNKQWRAFLSAVEGEDGQQVNAIDRVGEGPWYDRLGRLFAENKADLLTERPTGIDAAIKDDFPNEDGVPNHQPNPVEEKVDNHDTLTGTNEKGELYSKAATCDSWTGKTGNEGRPRVGHSWPRYGMGGGGGGGGGNMGDGSAANWMSSLDESGCAPGVNLIEMGGPQMGSNTVGSGGGYGGIYCFALTP